MSFDLNTVVPWGRNMGEYRAMFTLSDGELKTLRILDCGGGPSSFNAQLTSAGGTVISCDPLYAASRADIEKRISETFDIVLEQTRRNRDNFIWNGINDPDKLGYRRMKAMRSFLDDFETGRGQGRYVDAALPKLPFADNSFDLALSSHFLFLYTEQLSLDFHIAAILEMCRVARELRVFPILDMQCNRSAYLAPVMAALAEKGRRAEIVPVDYEFQKGAKEMLRITI